MPRDLLAGRWPNGIGFAGWNAAFHNDPAGREYESDMRVGRSPHLAAVCRSLVGDDPRVLDSMPARP